jgi:hypothetical protein
MEEGSYRDCQEVEWVQDWRKRELPLMVVVVSTYVIRYHQLTQVYSLLSLNEIQL